MRRCYGCGRRCIELYPIRWRVDAFMGFLNFSLSVQILPAFVFFWIDFFFSSAFFENIFSVRILYILFQFKVLFFTAFNLGVVVQCFYDVLPPTKTPPILSRLICSFLFKRGVGGGKVAKLVENCINY